MNHRHGFNDRNLHLFRSVPSGFLGRTNNKFTAQGSTNWVPYMQGTPSENVATSMDSHVLSSNIRYDKSVYKELSIRYDICAATVEELEEIARALYQCNEITLYDYAMLTFRPSAGGNTRMGLSGKNFTKRDRKNWIHHFEEKVLLAQNSSNMSAYLHEKHLLIVLKKLKRKD